VKVKSIKNVGKKPVYDISVDQVEQYVLANGVTTHNTGLYYSANQIFIIGRSQEKDGTEITGWNFTLNIEKSRFVKEKSKLAIQVSYDEGINPFSGLLDMAIESGHVTKPKNGWYNKTGETKNVREKDTNTYEFWNSIVEDETFKEFVKGKYMLTTKRAMIDETEAEGDE